MALRGFLLIVILVVPWQAPAAESLPDSLRPFFQPPEKLAQDFGDYRSPLKFDDGGEVKTAAEWPKRRAEILKTWTDLLGEPPPLLKEPKVEFLEKERRENFTQHHLRIEVAPERLTDDCYLLVPDGDGPFPAAVVVFYEAKTGIGLGPKSERDFARQLTRRGFVTLSVGSAPGSFYPDKETCFLQPLTYHAYEAANCHSILARLPYVDAERIGVVGHSYGGKWALFAGAMHEKFACVAVSDPGIVFDERRSNVNYWEPWYLGFDRAAERKPGIPSEQNPRTGPYRLMRERSLDLHELHALLAPRPLLVSGGAEDPPERWQALNHLRAVNRLLGYENRVAMTNRPAHDPSAESNAVLVAFFAHFLKAPAAP